MDSPDIGAVLAATRGELVDHWRDLFNAAPPPRLSRGMMARIVADELQWRASGRARVALLRQLKKVVRGAEPKRPTVQPGARLVREWNGRRYVVEATSEGFLWNGRTWKSLSAIAREITGARWSGPRFFGVRS